MQPKTKGRTRERRASDTRLRGMSFVQGSQEPWPAVSKGRAGPALGQEDRVENEPEKRGETGGRGA